MIPRGIRAEHTWRRLPTQVGFGTPERVRSFIRLWVASFSTRLQKWPPQWACVQRPINCIVGRNGQWCQALALQRIHTRRVEQKLPAFLVNFIYDELVVEVREDLVDEVSTLVVNEMTSAFLELFKLYKPEPVAWGLVEVGVGCNYAQVK